MIHHDFLPATFISLFIKCRRSHRVYHNLRLSRRPGKSARSLARSQVDHVATVKLTFVASCRKSPRRREPRGLVQAGCMHGSDSVTAPALNEWNDACIVP